VGDDPNSVERADRLSYVAAVVRMKKRGRDIEGKVARFMQMYRRKKPRGRSEPNDREYDRKLEALVKRLPPEELDQLMNGEDGAVTK
jgi:hypothetical protein